MIKTDEANPDHSLTIEDITAQVIMIPIEAAVDHNVGTDTATTGAVHGDLTQSKEATIATIDLATTHYINHIAILYNIKALQVINPEIVVGYIYDHPTDPWGTNHIDQVHNPAGQK